MAAEDVDPRDEIIRQNAIELGNLRAAADHLYGGLGEVGDRLDQLVIDLREIEEEYARGDELEEQHADRLAGVAARLEEFDDRRLRDAAEAVKAVEAATRSTLAERSHRGAYYSARAAVEQEYVETIRARVREHGFKPTSE